MSAYGLKWALEETMSRLDRLKNLLARLLRRGPKSPPPDPSERLVPVRRGPRPRSGAAIAESDENSGR